MTTPSLRRLGATELQVHPICLGGNVFGWTADRETSFAILDAYVEGGGNWVDTSDVYSTWVPGHSGGESETLIGEWLTKRGRDSLIVATKVGSGSKDLEPGLAREQVIAGCDASLRRLGIECIDLYYAHHDRPETTFEETLGAFDELVRGGKVRYIAASNHSAPRLREALETSEEGGLAGYSALQPRLNLVDRDRFAEDLRDVCLEYELGVAVYRALANGFLTGKYRPDRPEPSSPRAPEVESEYLSNYRARAVLEAASVVATRRNATVGQVAVAWALAQSPVTSVIASATSPRQVAELLRAATLNLNEQDLHDLQIAGEG